MFNLSFMGSSNPLSPSDPFFQEVARKVLGSRSGQANQVFERVVYGSPVRLPSELSLENNWEDWTSEQKQGYAAFEQSQREAGIIPQSDIQKMQQAYAAIKEEQMELRDPVRVVGEIIQEEFRAEMEKIDQDEKTYRSSEKYKGEIRQQLEMEKQRVVLGSLSDTKDVFSPIELDRKMFEIRSERIKLLDQETWKLKVKLQDLADKYPILLKGYSLRFVKSVYTVACFCELQKREAKKLIQQFRGASVESIVLTEDEYPLLLGQRKETSLSDTLADYDAVQDRVFNENHNFCEASGMAVTSSSIARAFSVESLSEDGSGLIERGEVSKLGLLVAPSEENRIGDNPLKEMKAKERQEMGELERLRLESEGYKRLAAEKQNMRYVDGAIGAAIAVAGIAFIAFVKYIRK